MSGDQQLERNEELDKFGYFKSKRAFLFPDLPDYVDTKAITGVTSALTVPEGMNYAILGYKGDVAIAVKKDAAATYPSGTVADGTGSFINPTQFCVADVTTINIISDGGSTVVSVAYYK